MSPADLAVIAKGLPRTQSSSREMIEKGKVGERKDLDISPLNPDAAMLLEVAKPFLGGLQRRFPGSEGSTAACPRRIVRYRCSVT